MIGAARGDFEFSQLTLHSEGSTDDADGLIASDVFFLREKFEYTSSIPKYKMF
jgi:hypothetical protein